MAETRKTRVLEIAYSSKKHAKQLRELDELVGLDVLDDTAACRSYLLKGLQRFLFMCVQKGIPVNQAILNLSVQGLQFDTGEPCNASIEELLVALSEMEVGRQVMLPKTVVQMVEISDAGIVKLENPATEVAPSQDEDDWSAFAGVTGVINK